MTKFGDHRAFLNYLTSGWSRLIPAWHLTLNNALRSDQGFFRPNLVVKKGIPAISGLWLTLDEPSMTFEQGNVLRSGQGFFQPNLVEAYLSNLTSGWPLTLRSHVRDIIVMISLMISFFTTNILVPCSEIYNQTAKFDNIWKMRKCVFV